MENNIWFTLIDTDTDDIRMEGKFQSFKELAKYLYDNYNNTGEEISINDTVCMGVGLTPYIDRQDSKYVPTLPCKVHSAFKHIAHGYKGLAKALRACTKYYDGMLIAYV